MKRIIMLCLIVCSCYQNNEIEVKELYGYTFKHDMPEFSSIEHVYKYTYLIIDYIADETDYWQTPEETYNLKTGDCEDFALFIGYILTEMGHDVNLALIDKHIILNIDGIYMGSVFYDELNPANVYWECSFYEAIWMTTNYHDSVGEYY